MGEPRVLPSYSRKRTEEDLKLTFSFENDIASGETILTATTTAAVWSGTDASPNDIVSGSASISGAKVTQLVINGSDGVTYILEFHVTTDQAQAIEGMALLEISDTESESG